ncbi:hypothetical protein [Pantoea stewartii]|uniref:Uncharacterized protein n=1 Tax=Pantoea stewartii subsp. stewartii DC283 TaxID=660596 RepID=H3RDU0_PANSE|nr:hypothetical protein [Pantoea stewartii]ARF49993.1 hypothetical protein DSJ_11995 [Pantoea stewartii subsp. stewartii DC283]EHU00529.1 hypothetical protein CKS_2587 [Pantoea stewartii subsp. stewartii DC283]
MTTNSPNPVDGDVQALIADCQHDISSINREIDRYSQLPHAIPETLVSLRSQLKRQQIALAALTAEPVAYAHTKVINDLLDKRRCCGTVWIKSDDESSVEPLHALYTTPTAQLLRPVELPGVSDLIDSSESIPSVRDVAIWDSAVAKCAELLRQQGYEVKSNDNH